ncbi:MAG TPA: YihY/virulence factor BrkB family protein [Candidatus Angelobacter sp.]|jgi:membrane protein
MKSLKTVISALKSIFRGFERKHLALVSAGLAYYFLMSLFPTLVLLAAGVGYLSRKEGARTLAAFLSHVMPPQGLALLEQASATITPHRTGLLSFGLIASMWLISIAVKGIIAGLDIVYEVRAPRSLWINRILAFALTIAVGILLLLAISLTLAGPLLESALEAVVPLQSLWIRAWPYIQWLLAATFIFAAIELLYVLAPNVPFARRVTIPGAALAASGWLALSWGLGFYFQHFGQLKLDAVYGILATPIALVIWLYWGAAVILLGAEVNVNLQRHKKPRTIVTAEQPPAFKDVA